MAEFPALSTADKITPFIRCAAEWNPARVKTSVKGAMVMSSFVAEFRRFGSSLRMSRPIMKIVPMKKRLCFGCDISNLFTCGMKTKGECWIGTESAKLFV